MKKIKVFALPSHQTKDRTSGVDFARIIQPMKHLDGYTDEDVEFEVDVYDIAKEVNWLDVAKKYDIIYFNYLNSPWGFAAMGAMARKFKRKIVMDLDDNLWGIREDNPAHEVYQKGGDEIRDFTAICNEVDYITVTNSYLKNVVINNTYKKHDKVIVFPNYVDLKLYSHRPKFKDTEQIQLVHYGSTTHFEDLSDQEFMTGVGRILSEYPNVSIRFIGAFIPKFKQRWGRRYESVYGHTDIYKWIKEYFPKFMDEADIIIVPLVENVYTRCKSSIKWIEASSAGKPGVWQNVRQYKEVITGENGLLARTADEWYAQLKKLIDDPKLRKKMGQQAYKDVRDNWTMQLNVSDYAEFFKGILTNKE